MNIASYIDHAILGPATTNTDIKNGCMEAKENGYINIYVPPIFVKQAKALTNTTGIKVITVIGFPFGYSAIEAKLAEIVLAIVDGADEIDIVINIAALKSNDWQYLAKEVNSLFPILKSRNKIITITIESSLLSNEEIIKCCDLYGAAGADFIKTSTGYTEKGTTLESVKLIRKHLADAVQIKAGGINLDHKLCCQFINAGANRIVIIDSMQLIKEAVHENAGMIFEKQ